LGHKYIGSSGWRQQLFTCSFAISDSQRLVNTSGVENKKEKAAVKSFAENAIALRIFS
jgi:hypothetical protein